MNKFDLEERLIDFVVLIFELTKSMPSTKASNHLIDQIIRSSSSTALNYGEAQSGESRRDFIHKMKIILKELRESYVCLKIIYRANLYTDKVQIEKVMNECNELISIFVKSVETAQKNMSNK